MMHAENKTVASGLALSSAGIDSISVDMKEKKLTVIGTVDPIDVVIKLRKHWQTDIITVGPAKEPEKKEEKPQKEASKGEQPQQQEKPAVEPKKDEQQPKGEEGQKKPQPPQLPPPDPMLELVRAHRAYNPHMSTYYHVHSMEENPNACIIC